MEANNIRIKQLLFLLRLTHCLMFSEQSLYCWSEWLEDGYRFFLLAEAYNAPKYVLVCIAHTFLN